MGLTKRKGSNKLFHQTSKEGIIARAEGVGVTLLPLQFLVYKRLLTYMEHVARMAPDKPQRVVFFVEAADGKRTSGRPCMSLRETV